MTDRVDSMQIVCLSGGKDSTAMALRLAELNPGTDYLYICTPTGDELPDMEAHWTHIESLLGKPLLRIASKHGSIYDLIDEFKMLPNWRARWCTRILKIETAQEFYEEHKPAIIYVGLRADEEKRVGNKVFDDDIEQCFPMQTWGWGINEVMAYLDDKGIEIPRRTDCAMCFYQRIGEWWNLWKEYPEKFQQISDLEAKISHTLLSPGKFTNWPSKLSDMGEAFASGRRPRGAGQMDLYKRDGMCRVCSL